MTETIIAYIDESGDSGDKVGGSTLTYTLGCVIVKATDWNSSFDGLISMRRRIKTNFGIPVRVEIKANYLIRNGGSLKNSGLTPRQRSLVYREHLKQMAQDANLSAFAVVVHKSMSGHPSAVVEAAWTALLQRLQRTSVAWGGCPVIIVHDEGENARIRKVARGKSHLYACESEQSDNRTRNC